MLEELRRRKSADIYGWDCPLLTFIYPGFEQVAQLICSWGLSQLHIFFHEPQIPETRSSSREVRIRVSDVFFWFLFFVFFVFLVFFFCSLS